MLGVSPDNVEQHVKFKEKYSLPFTLLADPEHEVAERYDVWGEKLYGGRAYLGVYRSTFLVAPDGTVAKVMHDVKPATHADDVLAALGSACRSRNPLAGGLLDRQRRRGSELRPMHLFLRDPSYTHRLAAFLTSVGRRAVVAAPDRVDLDEDADDLERLEVEMYLRVWRVLHPEADVELATS